MQAMTDAEWAWVEGRRAGAPFLIGVKTTGIFCRTGCAARTPLRKNVVVLTSVEEALAQGFRPCKKCKPMGEDPDLEPVLAVAQAVKGDPTADWTADSLAALVDFNPRALRQRFMRLLGVSPVAFRDGVRLGVFKPSLRKGSNVTDAGYKAGYSGPARRHEAAKALGMTPSTYAKGGAGEVIDYVVIDTALGPMVVAATDKGICMLHFRDKVADAHAVPAEEFPAATVQEAGKGAPVVAWAEEVARFLAEGGLRPDLPVDLRGTAFQMKVWQALRALKPGETTTYGALAAKIGHPGASRAVGSANGKNPVAVVVPCHMVVAAGGKLGGYAGGLPRKRKLLALEGASGDLFDE